MKEGIRTNAIVTGAGRHSGIGAEICRAFADKGINIYFTSFDEYDSSVGGFNSSDYDITLQECRGVGAKAYFNIFDLSKQENVCALFDDAISKLGDIDILVNCLCFHQFDSIEGIVESLMSRNLQVNVSAVFFLCQEFYRRYKGDRGRIVNLSSTQNLEPLTTEIAYAISKTVVPTIVSTLAPLMASKGITINAVNPGATQIGDVFDPNIDYYRDCNLFGRLGKPEDVANLICFLTSDEGRWITGQTINSEGGVFRGLTKFRPKEG